MHVLVHTAVAVVVAVRALCGVVGQLLPVHMLGHLVLVRFEAGRAQAGVAGVEAEAVVVVGLTTAAAPAVAIGALGARCGAGVWVVARRRLRRTAAGVTTVAVTVRAMRVARDRMAVGRVVADIGRVPTDVRTASRIGWRVRIPVSM